MNPFSFLGKIGPAFKQGIGKFGQMGAGDDAEGAMMPRPQLPRLGPGGTGGFAGNEGLPQIGGDSGLINRPQPQPNTLPQLQRPEMPPRMEPIRDTADVSAMLPAGQVGVSPQQTQMIPQRQVGEVRPPDFLGPKGSTMDDTPMNHARYRYQTEYMNEGKIPRRWPDIAMAALHGAAAGMQNGQGLGGALGGAIAGGAGAGISPLHARDFRFRQEQMPRLQQQQQERWQLEDRTSKQAREAADLEGTRARTAATIAGTKDAELERQYRKAQIEKMNAQTEAAMLGKPVVKMITDENTGEIYEAQIYPDGRVERRGLSGTADLRQEGFRTRKDIAGQQIKSREGIADKQISSRERIVGQQQSGANYRAGMGQAGQNARQKERLSAQYGDGTTDAAQPYGPPIPPQGKAPVIGSVPVKRATSGDVSEYAKQKGISPAEARKRFEAKGYRVE